MQERSFTFQTSCAAIAILFMVACEPAIKHKAVTLQLLDANLTMELVTDEIPTPIGLAIDENDQLYVLESHTHTPSREYQGPAFDRIKKGNDRNGDGLPETWSIYADSIEDGMNLAFGPEHRLFLTTKNAVWVFQDGDGNGIADQRQLLLKMVKPESPYDHAAILGLAVSPDNQWLFISRGNTGSAHWVINGTDGSSVSGYGDGGNVMRCRLDGSELEEVATGFWNPFDLKFIMDGRLMLTDNDPDSRGPNRLIELVPGGDYGYKSLYGGSGIHPFVAWNGELPGTLPYAAPLGEAPCALLDASTTNFGSQYGKSILVNIWEEQNIVKIPMSNSGSTITGVPQVLVQGDSTFHPVALVVNSKGDVYITDWVLREYPNHGKGEIWRLRGKNPSALGRQPQQTNRFGDFQQDLEQDERILVEGDPFQQAMARNRLRQTAGEPQLTKLLHHQDSEMRIQALLIFYQKEELLSDRQLQQLLQDQDQQVRLTALFYIGTKQVTSMLPTVEKTLNQGLINADLFEMYLATIQNLQPEFVQAYQQKSGNANKLPRKLAKDFILEIVSDEQLNEELRALALPYLEDLPQKDQMLKQQLQHSTHELFQAALLNAIGSISHAFSQDQSFAQLLLQITLSDQYTDRVRANALALMPRVDVSEQLKIKGLLDYTSPVVQYAVIKYLSVHADDQTSNQIDRWMAENLQQEASLRSVWDRKDTGFQAGSVEHLEKVPDEIGNPERGELVFKARTSQCLTCHKVDGWGGAYGPDLSHIGSSKNQQQLINAILEPSAEMAPEWQGWYVIDAHGNRHVGRQIDVHLDRIELMNINGEFDTFKEARSFGISTNSLMPEGLQNTMTRSEFNDLISYLMMLE